MFETSDPKQRFYVANQIELFPNDEQNLIKLYQPLVGAVAIALYQTLIQNYDPYAITADAKGLYYIQEQLDCSLKQFFNSLHKLEAAGLVQTFLAEDKIQKTIIFKLLKVPDAQHFFATPLLASLLKEKIGVTAFTELSRSFARKSKLKQKTFKNARDVSASFFDVFRLSTQEAIDPSAEVRKAATDNYMPVVATAQVNQNDHIDWDFLKQQFEMYQIESHEVEQHKAEIRGLMQLYGLNEQEFVEESLPSLHGKNVLDIRQIQQLLANGYRIENTRKQIQKQVNKAPTSTIKGFSAKEQKLLQDAQQMSPAEFLYQIKAKKGGFATAPEKYILNNLHNQFGLPTDLINILTYVCLQYEPVVSSSLAYKIANDWLQNNVNTAPAALKYIINRPQNIAKKYRTAGTYHAQKLVEQGTDWSKKKAKQNVEMTDEEMDKIFKNLTNDESGK